MSLDNLLDKESIIDTFSADRLADDPVSCETDYREHLLTYVAIPGLRDQWDRLLDRLKSGRVLGYLYAPIGYGKTAAACDLWQMASSSGFVCTPPFHAESLQKMVLGVYAWLKHALASTHPEHLSRLDDLFARCSTPSVDQLALDVARRAGRSVDDTREILGGVLAAGRLRVDIAVNDLVAMLEGCCDLATESGFRGLLVIVDEFDLFSKSNSDKDDNVGRFKDLVWKLRTEKRPLGFVVSMPHVTWAEMNYRAQDILHRLGGGEFKVDLEKVYGPDFVSALWNKMADVLEFSADERNALGADALESLGQFCSDTQLANGPRSAISAFRYAALHCAQGRNRTYTVLDLIEDYVGGRIAFDGRDRDTAKGLAALFRHDLVRTEEDKLCAKLLAAFPDGCPSQVVDSYHVGPQMDSLVRATLGDLTIHKSGGRPTLAVYKESGSTDIITEQLKAFRAHYNPTDRSCKREALTAFCNFAMPKLLVRGGWTGLLQRVGPELALSLGTSQVLAGSPSERFPLRTVRLTVQLDEPIEPIGTHIDQCDFEVLLELSSSSARVRMAEDERRRLTLRLSLGCPVDATNLTRDVDRLGDIFLPKDVTPQLLLAAMQHLYTTVVAAEGVSVPDQRRAESLCNTVYPETIIRELFDESLRASLDAMADVGLGASMLVEMMGCHLSLQYPEYVPLATTGNWKQLVMRCVAALSSGELSLAQRRGYDPLVGSKRDLAQRFNYAGESTTAFHTQFASMSLAKVLSWSGPDGSLLLPLHPLETKIVALVDASDSTYESDGGPEKAVWRDELLPPLREAGYLRGEVDLAIALLEARAMVGHAQVDDREVVYRLTARLTAADLIQKANELEKSREEFVQVYGHDFENMVHQITDVVRSLGTPEPSEEALDAARSRLDEVGRSMNTKALVLLVDLVRQLSVEAEAAAAAARQEPAVVLDVAKRPIAATPFSHLLQELRMTLKEQHKRMTADWKARAERAQALLTRYQTWKETRSSSIAAIGQTLKDGLLKHACEQDALSKAKSSQEGYERDFGGWIDLARQHSDFWQRLALQSPVSALARRLKNQVEELGDGIKGEMAERKLAVLGSYAVKAQALALLAAEWEKDIEDHQKSFNELKEKYTQLMRDVAGVARFQLREQFDPQDPSESVARLRQEVAHAVDEYALEPAGAMMRSSIQTEIRKIILVYDLEEDTRREASKLDGECDAVLLGVTALRDRLDPNVVADLEVFRAFVSEIAALTSPTGTVAALKEAVDRLRQAILKTTLTPTEEILLDHLRRRNGDVTEVLKELVYATERQAYPDISAAMRDLLGLYRKGRINMECRVLVW